MISLLAFLLTVTFFSCSDLEEDISPEIETPTCYSVLQSNMKDPELRNLLNTTNIFFEGMELVATDEEWHDYCKNILKVIENSDIPTSDKKALKMGVTVGYASSKLWKPE